MSKVANTYWVDERIRSQHVAQREISSFAPVRQISVDILEVRAAVGTRDGVIPSWVIFGMIILAALALCVTVTMRTRAKMNTAAERYVRMQTNVETLRRTNQVLRAEVEELRSDPRVIESAARSRLNMVRVNEIVVPAE